MPNAIVTVVVRFIVVLLTVGCVLFAISVKG
jgi:hypothetical protein